MDYKKLLKVLKNSKQVYREDYVRKIFRSSHYDIGLFETQLNEFNQTMKGNDSALARQYMDRTILAQVLDDASILLEIAKDNKCLSEEQNESIIGIIDKIDTISEDIEVIEQIKALAELPEGSDQDLYSRERKKIFANV
ncbi:hypothetical protein [Methanolobus halotolerans]|uniref:Uncharacterized protein n=1 Tax=Methanolobus halotolerans TaxID=2052935 RepID=A0A4E0Q1D0_9EURY|nr:hypothetical protein [Methanolobus halotolerans]TGC10885.1 hypothetical protein CUN85_01635 [Methanolobus halotolerans]